MRSCGRASESRRREAICPNCNEPGRPEFVSAIDEDSPLAAEPLSRVGIPPYDIVRVDGAAESGFFLLAADRGLVQPGLGNRPLSGDEIIFGEMTVREPERRLRPDRDRRFAYLAYEVPGPADLPIFLDRMAADAIERHALSDTSVELGGILLGKECLDQQTGQPFVWITHSLEAKHYANTQASFTYTHDSWEEITRQRDQRFPTTTSWGGITPIPASGSSCRTTTCSFTSTSSRSRSRWLMWSTRSTRREVFFSGATAAMAQVAGYYLTADRGDRHGAGQARQRPGATSQFRSRLRRNFLSSPRGGADQHADSTHHTS